MSHLGELAVTEDLKQVSLRSDTALRRVIVANNAHSDIHVVVSDLKQSEGLFVLEEHLAHFVFGGRCLCHHNVLFVSHVFGGGHFGQLL